MNPQYPIRLTPVFEDTSLSCPSCGHGIVHTTYIEHKFPYGAGDRSVELSANVPLRRCAECEVEFFDSVAEELQHEAVCRHLGVMIPTEVQAVRKKMGSLSRAEFARITRLGEATISRWERGELIQNAANDQLLYLLTFPENVKRLRDRVERPIPVAIVPPRENGNGHIAFRVISRTPFLEEEAALFCLTKPGVA